MHELNQMTRKAVFDVFEHSGIEAADAKIKDLLIQCEQGSSAVSVRDRSTIKGELSEISLECHILFWMQHIKQLIAAKGLCMKSMVSNATAEIDMLLATPCRVYLFECKSFKGKKTLSKECFLQGTSSSKDVYEQSRYHLKVLEQHISEFRIPSQSKLSPYQLILFELSSDGIIDTREEKWKKNIPVLTADTFDAWLVNEFRQTTEVRWDLVGLSKKLRELDSKSAQMFKYHMTKIMNRKG